MDDLKLTLICLGLSNLTTVGLFLVLFYNLRKEERIDRHGRKKKC